MDRNGNLIHTFFPYSAYFHTKNVKTKKEKKKKKKRNIVYQKAWTV